jgi:hypothetical protein
MPSRDHKEEYFWITGQGSVATLKGSVPVRRGRLVALAVAVWADRPIHEGRIVPDVAPPQRQDLGAPASGDVASPVETMHARPRNGVATRGRGNRRELQRPPYRAFILGGVPVISL